MKILHSKGSFTGAKKRVFIAVPSFSLVTAEVLYSLFGAKEALIANGIESELFIVTENCHVDDGRNFCVRCFLEGKCTDLIFIDADVRFDPEDIVRLALYFPDVVAGIYPKKQDCPVEYPVQFIDGDLWSNKEGLIEVKSVPTGFLKISRNAIEQLDKAVPHYLAQKDVATRRKIPLIFERTLREQTRLGGDYEFCHKWRDLGGKIFIDPEMNFGHVGTSEWNGCIGDFLRKINGLTEQRIVELIEKIKVGEETPRDINSIWNAWDNEWTPPAEMLSTILMIARDGTGPILECGSGLTTLILGSSGRKVISLEHDLKWKNRVETFIDLCGGNIDLIYTPVIKDGWYDVSLRNQFPSLVIVDGPPRGIGDRSKIVDHLDNVSSDCIFIVDDVGTDLDACYNIGKKFNVEFNYFGRYAIGRKK